MTFNKDQSTVCW